MLFNEKSKLSILLKKELSTFVILFEIVALQLSLLAIFLFVRLLIISIFFEFEKRYSIAFP
jgi:hypothetical protein